MFHALLDVFPRLIPEAKATSPRSLMTALASLDSDLLEMILDRTDLIAAVQLTSTCKALEARRGGPS